MSNREYIVNSFTTITEMLEDRGIPIKEELSIDVISEWISNNIHKSYFSIIYKKIKIIYFLPFKFKLSELKQKINEDNNETYELIILVIKEKLTQNNIKLNSSLNLPIQLFDINELQFNITKHILVPKHELIKDEKEVLDIIQKYNLKTKFQLPYILKTDPISKYLGLKNGDIVRIVRVSPTAGEYITYRCCV